MSLWKQTNCWPDSFFLNLYIYILIFILDTKSYALGFSKMTSLKHSIIGYLSKRDLKVLQTWATLNPPRHIYCTSLRVKGDCLQSNLRSICQDWSEHCEFIVRQLNHVEEKTVGSLIIQTGQLLFGNQLKRCHRNTTTDWVKHNDGEGWGWCEETTTPHPPPLLCVTYFLCQRWGLLRRRHSGENQKSSANISDASWAACCCAAATIPPNHWLIYLFDLPQPQ